MSFEGARLELLTLVFWHKLEACDKQPIEETNRRTPKSLENSESLQLPFLSYCVDFSYLDDLVRCTARIGTYVNNTRQLILTDVSEKPRLLDNTY